MKEIKLTQGSVVIVDDEDFQYLNQWKWCALKHRYTYYAVRSGRINGKKEFLYMHRVIMNTPVGMETDHQDHNGLNCQRYNLRNCTHQQNAMNRNTCGVSKYLGVSIVSKGKQKGEIRASIQVNGKQIHLGCFKSEITAAKARDIASKKHFGEFANLNFK